MVIHPFEIDRKGAGNWDNETGRYVPLGGGSRMRLPVADGEGTYNRYPGFVGIDEKLTESIRTMADLYAHIGGAAGGGGREGEWASRIREVAEEQRKAEEEEIAQQSAYHPSAE